MDIATRIVNHEKETNSGILNHEILETLAVQRDRSHDRGATAYIFLDGSAIILRVSGFPPAVVKNYGLSEDQEYLFNEEFLGDFS